jgi:uncharacterized lipoprotein YbaY
MSTQALIWITVLSLCIAPMYAVETLSSEVITEMNQVTGFIYYPEDFSMPSQVIVYVTLTDVSPLQDSSSEIVARQIISSPEQSSPLYFELPYDSSKIMEHHLYAIQVRMTVAGQVIRTNSSAYPVITQGNPTTVEVFVQ